MTKVTLYKITITQGQMASECGTHYDLSPYGDNTRAYTGYDDGGNAYLLPDGYTVGQTEARQAMIYDARNVACDILNHSSGRPQLVSVAHSMPVLTLA